MGSEDLWNFGERGIYAPPPDLLTWNPPYSGDIDIFIDHHGTWFHEGIEFKRKSLVEMFARILRKEHDDYYLVTPVEKWKIRVADVPFIVVDYRNTDGIVSFRTSLGDQVSLIETNPIVIKRDADNNMKPYIHVRHGIEAIISRSVYYALAENMTIKNGKHGIFSGGTFFLLE